MSSRRPFLALAVAETFSISGTRLSTIAIPWLVLSTTGDPVLTGLVAMLEILPYVASRALGGPLIDRLGARRISVVCDTLSIGVIALVPLLHVLEALSIGALLPIVFMMGVLRGPSDASKQAMMPEVATVAAVPLERVTGVMGAIERLASAAGAAAAGALIALIGPETALWCNAATFAVAAVVVRFWLPALRIAQTKAVERQSYMSEFAEGWDFLRRDAVLVSIVVMCAITNFFDQAYAAVLLPVWTQSGGHGPQLLGWLLAAFSAASICGSALAATFGERLPRLIVYSVAFLLTGFPRFAVFALDAPLVAIFATIVVGGFASGFLNPILFAVAFERIPKPLLGRVTSLYAALCWTLIPFGGLAGGALINAIGLRMTLMTMGLGYLMATLMPLTVRSFRGIERRAT